MLLRFIITILILILSNVNAEDLVRKYLKSYGYPVERYDVETEDGYILSLHRIPPKTALIKSPGETTGNNHPETFILMHGVIGSGADFILAGRNRALGCILHDQGYDVWLPSARGTTLSKRHRTLNATSREFWDFSWHEIGYYDIPAIIDFILEKTGISKVHYVGHSQGCTVLLVMLCDRPEYNEKVNAGHLLAPVASLSHLRSPLLLVMASKSELIQALIQDLGITEFLSSTALNQIGGRILCGPEAPTQPLCLFLTYFVVGFSDFQIDRELLPKIFDTTPAGISARQFLHFGQVLRAMKFQHFDFGTPKENYQQYGSRNPPEYDLKKVRTPLNLFYGTRDLLLTKPDAYYLANRLVNSPYTITELRGFNHIDFLYGAEAPRRVYKDILRFTRKMELRSTT